jgi:glycosyltransferase involved in cell wall biosynthesis
VTVTHIVVGPRRHGVVRFGLALHDALRAQGLPTRQLWPPDVATLIGSVEGGSLHLQFTDRLFGDSPEAAARAVADLARRATVTVTLHDLPQPSDGVNAQRRAAAYATVAARSAGVVVNSAHERELLRTIGVDVRAVRVIPLPIDAPVVVGDRPSGPPVVGVFGFLYPGKGHDEVIAATAGLPSDVEVHALGEASAGHDSLVDDLERRARACGRVFRVTGHIPDDALTAVLQSITVPVVAHTHVSASGSLGSWLSASRRPIAPTNRYTREVADRNPGMLTLYPEDGLAAAIETAFEDVDSTWLRPDDVPRPTPADVAIAYHDVFGTWHR